MGVVVAFPAKRYKRDEDYFREMADHLSQYTEEMLADAASEILFSGRFEIKKPRERG